jgi:hypothetical protein
MHPNGSILIMDRSKDIIISGGEVCNYSNLLRRMINPLVTPCFQNASSLAIEQGK